MPSFKVGSIFGIPIKVGVSFLLVLPLVAYLIGSQLGPVVEMLNQLLGSSLDSRSLTIGVLPWVLGAIAALGLFGGVILHELAHSLVAIRYGHAIESITLWFLGGLAHFVEFPDDWKQELTIALAGPVASVILGGGFYLAFIALPTDLPAARFVVGYLAVLNIVLAAFNLLPGFPMDGGRVLRALLSRNRTRLRATRIAAQVGKGFAILLGIAGILLANLFWLAIAFFIYMGASSETQQVVMESAFEGIVVGDIMTPDGELQTVTPETTLQALIDRMIRERHTGYPVLSDGTLVGVVTLEDAQSIDPEQRSSATVEQVMSSELATVSPTTGAAEAITMMQREDVGRLPVVHENGALAGLISRTDLMTVFRVIKSSPSADVAERATAD